MWHVNHATKHTFIFTTMLSQHKQWLGCRPRPMQNIMHILFSIQSQNYLFVAARFTQLVNAAGVAACWTVVEFCCDITLSCLIRPSAVCRAEPRTFVTVANSYTVSNYSLHNNICMHYLYTSTLQVGFVYGVLLSPSAIWFFPAI